MRAAKMSAWVSAMVRVVAAAVAVGAGAGAACAQNLLEQAVRPGEAEAGGRGGSGAGQAGGAGGQPTMVPGPDGTMVPAPMNAAPMGGGGGGSAAGAGPAPAFSLFQVVVPTPRTYQKHDLIEIIINESTLQSITQTNDLKKNSSLRAELARFPSLQALIQDATLAEGIGEIKPGVGVTSSNKFKGEAKVNRRDQLTARITATVIDVKPNGNLVLEARETITSDRELSSMVLAGTCRSADITRNNTVQSSQLANLNLRIERAGDTKDTAEKGVISRVLDGVFNF